jgi:hypothetical protein
MVENEKDRQGAVRACDTEREAAVRALATHFADGRLEQAEFDERTDAAFAARTRDELRQLFRDLPGQVDIREPAGAADGADAAAGAAPWMRGPGRGRGPMRAGGPPFFPLLPLVPVLLALSVVLIVHGLPPFPLIALFAVLAAGRRRRRWNRAVARPWL